MDNDILIILSHTNSPSKVEMLKQCISSLKKYNKKIILSTNSTFPEEIINEVDYILFDKNNPIIHYDDFDTIGTGTQWLNLGYYFQNVIIPNHAYCVLELMRNGVKLAHSLGYKNSHLIHYDCIFLDKEFINNNNHDLINNDIICYASELHSHQIDPNFISVHNQSFLYTFKDINNKKEYAYNEDNDTFETFLKIRFTNNNKTLIKPFNELADRNEVNIRKTGTFNGVINEITSAINYLDLVQDDNEQIYLNFRNNDNIEEVKINNITYKIKPYLNLFIIPKNILEKGITFSINSEGYDFKKQFNINSYKGACKLNDSSQLNLIEL